MNVYNEEKELYEAIDAAQESIEHLSRALTVLEKAKNWGLVDMFGGGTIVSMVKRNRMREANDALKRAERCIEKLKRELQDVREFIPDIYFNVNFLRFSDYVFDGFLVDYLVQKKINNAIYDVKETINVIDEILDSLEEALHRR